MNSIKIPSTKVAPSIKEGLSKLVDLDLDFYVAGGFLCQAYLKDHARYTKDIDIIYNESKETVEEKLKQLFGSIDFYYDDERDYFYEPSFTCFANINGEKAQIEGKRIEFFNKVKSVQYEYEGIKFKGVSIEYVLAEKLVSILNELSRPYKHLVDIYSFTQIDQSLLNKEEIMRYMNLINDQENKFRKKAGLKEYKLPHQIPSNKVFSGPVITTTLQSKYNISKEAMIKEVNKWILSLWQFCDTEHDNI